MATNPDSAYVNVYDLIDVAINGEYTQRLLACFGLECLARTNMFGDRKFLEITNQLRGLTSVLEIDRAKGGIYLVTMLTGENAEHTIIGATSDWQETHNEVMASNELATLSIFVEVPVIPKVDYEQALTEWLSWMLDVFDNRLIPGTTVARISENDYREFIDQLERLIRNNKLNITLYTNPMLKIASRELRHNWNFILSTYGQPEDRKQINRNGKNNQRNQDRNNQQNNNQRGNNGNNRNDIDYNQRDDRYYDNDRRYDDDRFDNRPPSYNNNQYDNRQNNRDNTDYRNYDQRNNQPRQQSRPPDNRRKTNEVKVVNGNMPGQKKQNIRLNAAELIKDSFFGYMNRDKKDDKR